MEKFEKIKKAVEEINAEETRQELAKIKQIKEWFETTRNGERYILKDGKQWTFEKLTDNQRKKTIKEQKEILTKKAIKKYQNKLTKKLKYIEDVEQCEPLERLEIFVNWTSGSVYGWQAKAEARAITKNGGEWFEGSRTGGCGYDKRSTATAEVLNKLKPLFYLICKKIEKKSKKQIKEILKRSIDGHDFIGYGFDFWGGAVGSFSGGVGFECHRQNLAALGFKCIAAHEGKTEDFYSFEYQNKGGKR